MRILTVIFSFVLLSASNGFARERPVPLSDRLGEADVVVVASVSEVDGSESENIDGGKTYLPVANLMIEEVLVGRNIKVGSTLRVSVSKPVRAMAMVELYNTTLKGTKSIWLLRTAVGSTHFEFIEFARTAPEKPEDWGLYLQPFREKAAEIEKFAPLRLDLSFRPGLAINALPIQATISLSMTGDKPISLPELGIIQFELINNETGIITSPTNEFHLVGAGKQSIPKLEPLNVRGSLASPEAMNLKPETVLTAKMLVRFVGIEKEKSPFTVYCIAKLTTKRGETIMLSMPTRILVVTIPLNDKNRQVVDKVTSLGLWECIGPNKDVCSADQIGKLKDLLREFPGNILEPAIKCGLAFSEKSGFTKQEKIDTFAKLSRCDIFGFAEECQLELARLEGRDTQQKRWQSP